MHQRRQKLQMTLPLQAQIPHDVALRGAFERAGLHRVGLHYDDVKRSRRAASLLEQLALAYRQGDRRSADIYAGQIVRMRSALRCADAR